MLALTIPRLNDAGAPQGRGGEPDWSLSATVIETCSCPVFCQCYFNTFPAAHVGHDGHGKTERFCRFNRALKINRGSLGKTQLDGVKFWMAGDLGGDFSHEEYDWAALTFEPSVTKDQRDAIVAIIPHLFPGRWNSFTVEKDAVLEWKQTKDHAEARLDGGKIAEVMLRKAQGMTDDPIIITRTSSMKAHPVMTGSFSCRMRSRPTELETSLLSLRARTAL